MLCTDEYYPILAINLFHLKRVNDKELIIDAKLLLAALLFIDSAMVSYGDEFVQFILAIEGVVVYT